MNFCFGSSGKSCFEFDGTTSTAIMMNPKHDHSRGGLGVYKNQLFAIGGGVMNRTGYPDINLSKLRIEFLTKSMNKY